MRGRWIYALSGRRSDALKVLAQLKELDKYAFVDQYNIAMVYVGLAGCGKSHESLLHCGRAAL